MLGQLSYSLTIRVRAIYLMYSTFMPPGIIKEEQKLLYDFYFEPIVGKEKEWWFSCRIFRQKKNQ